MIKVSFIHPKFFDELLKESLTIKERKAVHEMKKAQSSYAKLTLKRFIFFWLIYNKYKSIDLPIQKQIYEHYGPLREPKNKYHAFKNKKAISITAKK